MVIKNTFLIENRNAVLKIIYGWYYRNIYYGMVDFLEINFHVGSTGKIVGAYDIYNKNYVISLQKSDNTIQYIKSLKKLLMVGLVFMTTNLALALVLKEAFLQQYSILGFGNNTQRLVDLELILYGM